MGFTRSFWRLAVLSLLSFHTSAAILEDYEPPSEPSSSSNFFQKRDYSGLDLRNAETFMWRDAPSEVSVAAAGADTGSVLGNLTLYMEEAEEGILAMQRFRGMTKSIQCTDNAIDIAFIDDATFEYAKKTWDWVNGADNHSFALIAGVGDCGWNDVRVPFTISTLEYDEMLNVAHLAAKKTDWKSVAHTYDLYIGHMPESASASQLSKRITYNKDMSVDFNRKLPNPAISFPNAAFDVSIACGDCGTTGKFDMSFHAYTKFFKPKEATLTIHPKGLSAYLNPTIRLTASIGNSAEVKHTFPDIPIGGIEIPGIVTLGPVIETAVGLVAGPVQGSAGITTGAKFSLPDNAEVKIDLLHSKIEKTNWDPTVTQTPVKVDAKISGDVKMYAKAAMAVKADALGFGYEAQVKVEPYVKGSLRAILSPTGACPKDERKRPLGVGIFPSYGVAFVAAINSVKEEHDPIVSITLADFNKPLPDVCFGLGPDGNLNKTNTPDLKEAVARSQRRARLAGLSSNV